MPEPTLAMDFQDFILEVAEYLGVANYDSTTAAIPTDAHDLDICKRIVNRGWRRFANSNPKWNWVRQTASITFDADGGTDRVVDGDVGRYYMPDGFYGVVLDDWTYGSDTGLNITMENLQESHIRARRAAGQVTGYPSMYSLRPLVDDPKRRWEMLVWPLPVSDETVSAQILVYPNKLIELTDKPNAGYQFDEAILAAALAEAERSREDVSGQKESEWAEAVVRAIAIDQATAPKRLGYNGDQSDGAGQSGRYYTGVDTYENLDGTTHTFEL